LRVHPTFEQSARGAIIKQVGNVKISWDADEMTSSNESERLALCSEVVDKWIANKLGDVEAMLAIALITEPGARSFTEVAQAIRGRLEAGAPN
jgi:hypothetical protein